ncbi:MAG: tRNA uridine-5-carboxymethylaminomethyl(34) synthesis GTPase MnmE [Anaerovoracaceae bacterium]
MEDTIAAIATAPGEGGIGIIRISGDEALPILMKIFRKTNGLAVNNPEVRRMIYGNIIDFDGSTIDEAMVVYMKKPHTYTGEDVVEIQCHGSMTSMRKILSVVMQCGALAAERGEFTKRAFLNGRIDLSQAEAVIDVIRAKSDTALETAVSQLGGALSKRIGGIRKKMADLLSEIIARIEYPEEDFEELSYEKIIEDINNVTADIRKIYESADTGRIIRDGLRISIVGRPNVGKSSLLNLILNEDRAIVTDIPGTTRDTIQEYASIGGIAVILTDTAGIRETDDVIEQIGIEKSRNAVASSDLVIFMVDGSEPMKDEDLEIMRGMNPANSIVLINKSDISNDEYVDAARKKILEYFDAKHPPVISISAYTGEGGDLLVNAVKQFVYRGKAVPNHDETITNVRHANLIKQTLDYMNEAIEMLEAGEALDFAETDIRAAWLMLGEITGDSVSDDIISEVFSRFCLGK